MHAEDLAAVLLPTRDGEVGEADVEELDAAIAAGGQELVFMRFGPGRVEEAVLGFEELLADDAAVRQVENEEPAIAYETKVCAGADAQAAVEEGRVFYGVRVEACGAKLEHYEGVEAEMGVGCNTIDRIMMLDGLERWSS